MSRLHRFLLLCLLAVALPLQGFAAAAMVHCAGAPVETMAAADMDGMDMEADMHDHADAKATSHKGGCSASAACCVVAAPAAAFAPSFAVAPVETVALPLPRPRVAFLTDGPERPPRSLLA